MIPTWTITPHIKGDTFNSRKITFPFVITDCVIEMQFRLGGGSVIFYWSSENATFEKISTTEIIMKSRILDFRQGIYSSDLQVSFLDGTIKTYFKVNLQIT